MCSASLESVESGVMVSCGVVSHESNGFVASVGVEGKEELSAGLASGSGSKTCGFGFWMLVVAYPRTMPGGTAAFFFFFGPILLLDGEK